MQAIEAVLTLVKQRDEALDDVIEYETWFSSLVGKEVTRAFKYKNHTRFVDGLVTEFKCMKGWMVKNYESGSTSLMTFTDMANGQAWLTN